MFIHLLIICTLLINAISPRFTSTATHIPSRLEQRDYYPYDGDEDPLSSSLFSGRGTWFYPGLGACGGHATDSDFIVALSHTQYQDEHCYKGIFIINIETGKAAQAQIQDRCTGCNYGSIDMSPALFNSIAEGGLDQGVLPIAWLFSDDMPDDVPFDNVYMRRSLQAEKRSPNVTLVD